MTDSILSLLEDWEIPPVVSSLLLMTMVLYLRGWLQLRKTRSRELPPWRLVCFVAGIGSLFLAVASPLDTYSESLLLMHMAQHFVLMSVAPPLIVLGAPLVPLLRGIPRAVIRHFAQWAFRSSAVRRFGRFLMHPFVAWIVMNATFVVWHIPAAYEFALGGEIWHTFEHLCFFASSVLFWWLIVRPWPSHVLFSEWILIPYLLLSDLVNTGLSAFLCFSGRLLYPSYAEVERPFGLGALNDQVAAGAFMWVFGSIVFLVPAVLIMGRLLSSRTMSLQMQVQSDRKQSGFLDVSEKCLLSRTDSE
jgi:cytochrome c oxidase assembly factor CtaG